ncbi:MAG: DNA-directed RNA polymerase subunit K, partial [Candidatus Micrarchaeia archaeon]
MKKNYTRYEKAKIIGIRALQIAYGAPLLIQTNEMDPLKIAEIEFEKNLIPFVIIRKYKE